MKNKIYNYYITILNEYLLMSDNIDDILEEQKEEIIDEVYLANLLLKIFDLRKEQYYPEKSIKNIKKIITFIEKNKKENSPYLKEIKDNLELVNNLPTTENIYFYEYILKFVNIDNGKSLNNIDKYKKMIEESIKYDLDALKELISDNEEISNNKYYIYSIKKFLKDIPDLFLDINISKKALLILENSSNKIEKERLIVKIKNIKKYNNVYFDYILFKSFYDYILLQNMIIDKDFIRENANLIDIDIINNLYEFIDNEFIYDDKSKKNIIEIMSIYRDNIVKNSDKNMLKEQLKEYNDYIGKINLLDSYGYTMMISEFIFRTNKIYGKRKIFKLVNEIEELIKNDLDILNLFLYDKETYLESINELDKDKVYLSINKFLNVVPSMFDDQTIYERTMEILQDDSINNKRIKNKIKRITMRR